LLQVITLPAFISFFFKSQLANFFDKKRFPTNLKRFPIFNNPTKFKIMKIKIRFYIDKTKTNKTGNCPINCRITYNKNRKEFSTGIFIKPEYWDSQHQITEPPNDYINTQLSLINSKINKVFLLL